MKIQCPFLIKYKAIQYINITGIIYKCNLGNALLKSADLRKKWACGGCPVPWIINNKPCSYLKPHKTFLIRGSSKTWLSCELLNIVMDSSGDFCHLNCKIYEQNIFKK
ncbi:MAG: hypothetical protein PWR06_833 [Thermoanaerobacteraceae bacterium]|jgi:hypothetical protein|uniref:Uncharacterized protein n=1 Tax=Biomaibacter acetigenes TaxID=2316383 RepID=A0A3G2R5B1_9FIRM|nr:hypothetical protein [Biomaibacter acetigenes]MDK2878117.1 hypothetical protein [Thermoanaerobacteraceae bacterium]RKL64143.1 hypothetical protein DXT63_01940 [Thermoanaerobacteraceae bacterium SP2]AYO30569.1 hypothetical protein D2962_08010 [Biomaibacter acetigenes]MDN5301991.1 hypothetical protein [Thermoanaerobacteraceae bacterium]MDN5311535.1 hypothetical protein [Thermoanaerobacteraceae bacterium]